MRTWAHIAAGYLVLLLAGALFRVVPSALGTPCVSFVLACYLGVTAYDRLAGSVMGAVSLGYLADLLSGTPRGLLALCCGLVCVASRLASLRLLVRGRLFVFTFVFASSWVGMLLLSGVRAALVGGFLTSFLVGLRSALFSAFLAPPLFWISRRIDIACARPEREREAIREGLWS